MYWLFGYDRDSDIWTEGGDSIQENASDLAEKDTGSKKLEFWGNRLFVEEGTWKFGVFMVLNQKVVTKYNYYETEQPGHEGKLDVSISADGS